MVLPPWLTTIFSHSIGEVADGLWSKVTAEDKAANFGRGWGDEHQLLELIAKLKEADRPVWMDFVRWNFVDRNGFVTKNLARSRQKQLRLFLTSWDKLNEKGTQTKTIDKKVDDKTTEKVQTVEKVFKKGTSNARDFVVRCVQIITSKETEMLKQCEEAVPIMVKAGKLSPGYRLTKFAKQRCREAGYRELVKYFEAAQLPIMPAPDDGHWTESVDTWIKNQVGTEVQPVEVVKAAVVKIGAGMLGEMERDKARLAKAKKSWFAPILYPVAVIRNLFA
jgi:hypothetical protein